MFKYKIIYKKKIIELMKKNTVDLDYDLLPEIFIKFYRIYLFIIVRLFYNNSNVNIYEILTNNVDSLYLLKFKNIIVENHCINKLLEIIKKQIILFLQKEFGIKIKKIINENNNIKSIKSNEKCPITLEDLSNIYLYCGVCNTNYSLDGLMYWCQTNLKCTTPWCSNNVNKFNFCNEINLEVTKFSILSEIDYYYNMVILEKLISI